MTETERRLAARQFSVDWQGRGDEKQETQTFWLALLQKVYGIAEPDKYINFEKTVNVDNTKTGKSNSNVRPTKPSPTEYVPTTGIPSPLMPSRDLRRHISGIR